jgi:hypothetical protein
MDNGTEPKDINKGLPEQPADAQAIAIDDEAVCLPALSNGFLQAP